MLEVTSKCASIARRPADGGRRIYFSKKNPSTLHIWFSFVSHKQLAVDTGVAGYTCVCLYICNAILGGGQPHNSKQEKHQKPGNLSKETTGKCW